MAHFMLPQSAEIVSPELPSGGVTLPYQYSSTESCQSLQSISNPSNKSASSSSKTTKFSKPSLSPKVSQLKSKWITNWWATECFCWLISVLSLAAIVIILESYKNKPLPQWDFGLTLNSGISILATIGQMAMMKPVAECISQLKWLWFLKGEELVGFQIFEDASRGPTGSLLLLARFHRANSLVSLGAAITIASIAFGPFSQQIVSYPLRLHPVGNATVPQAFNLTNAGNVEGIASPGLTASFYEAFSTSNTNLSSLNPSCSTGNCTWDEYYSLAVCGSLKDVSSSLRNTTCNATEFEEIFAASGLQNPGYPCFNYTLPKLATQLTIESNIVVNASLSNGYDEGFYQGLALMKTMGLYPADTPNPAAITTAYLIYQPDFNPSSINSSLPVPIAYELDLNLCVQRYSTTVSNGRVNTTILSSQILEINLETVLNTVNESESYIGNDTFSSIGGDVFGATLASSGAFQNLAFNILSGECFFEPFSQFDQPFTGSNDSSFCDTSAAVPFFGALNSTDSIANVTALWENLASSITNSFRQGAGGNTVIGHVQGTALAPIAFVETQYLWLILPVGLVSFTLVFLIATIAKSQRLGSRVWKSSNLATLQGLHADLHTHLGGLSSISEMKEKAKDIKIQLDTNNGIAEKGMEYRLVESK